ncbi:MAG: cytochrome P450 [Pseudomonadales bacterium]|nr:cytochrome P450 [Pseudomonadales bacterium]
MAALLDETCLADPEVLERPADYYHALHERPIHFDKRLGFYICSTYGLMREILRNTEVFSSVDSQTVDTLRPPPAEALAIRRASQPAVATLVNNDPPSHTRFRSLVDDPFRPRSIERLIGQIRSVVDATLDAFIDRGECEVVADLAIPVPIRVIADMLGIPRELAPQIKAWSDASVEPLGMLADDARLIECARLLKEFQDFMVAELEARRARPRDDLLTHLVEARDADGAGFTMPEMLSLTQQFLVAGNETTTNAIAAGVQLLIENPDLQARLAAGREPNRLRVFANEVLRLESPVQGLFRIVTRDVELEGVRLPAGARVMVRFAAANRDPTKYHDPDSVDLDRHNAGTHLAFGAGIHHCIGANLAREELVWTFDALLGRARNFAFAEDRNDFRHHPSLILRGLKRLYVTFETR